MFQLQLWFHVSHKYTRTHGWIFRIKNSVTRECLLWILDNNWIWYNRQAYGVTFIENVCPRFVRKDWKPGLSNLLILWELRTSPGTPAQTNCLRCAEPDTDHVAYQRYASHILCTVLVLYYFFGKFTSDIRAVPITEHWMRIGPEICIKLSSHVGASMT